MRWRQAINAMCTQCIVDVSVKGNGTARQQITNCASTSCPLYELRPVTKPKKASTGNPVPEALRRYKDEH